MTDLDPNAEEWYVSVEEGHQDGPLSLSTFAGKWNDDSVEAAWIWREGMEGWSQLSDLPDVFDVIMSLLQQQQQPVESEMMTGTSPSLEATVSLEENAGADLAPDVSEVEVNEEEALRETVEEKESSILEEVPEPVLKEPTLENNMDRASTHPKRSGSTDGPVSILTGSPRSPGRYNTNPNPNPNSNPDPDPDPNPYRQSRTTGPPEQAFR